MLRSGIRPVPNEVSIFGSSAVIGVVIVGVPIFINGDIAGAGIGGAAAGGVAAAVAAGVATVAKISAASR